MKLMQRFSFLLKNNYVGYFGRKTGRGFYIYPSERGVNPVPVKF